MQKLTLIIVSMLWSWDLGGLVVRWGAPVAPVAVGAGVAAATLAYIVLRTQNPHTTRRQGIVLGSLLGLTLAVRVLYWIGR